MASESPYSLEGKTVVVTGANSGLGREAAAQFAGLGARVVLACRNIEAAEGVLAEIKHLHKGSIVQIGPQLDLAKPDSIRDFAKEYEKQGLPVHVLVNNAGANYMSAWKTEEGIPGIVQVNYLGPYMLTRLLDPRLIASAPSRVVNVSSVTHRYGEMTSAAEFLRQPASGVGKEYPATKLANVLFAFEHQRRLGHLGVQSCAVDPGSVATAIYRDSALFSRPPASWVIHTLYAPASDGARIIVDAARAPWAPAQSNPAVRARGANGASSSPSSGDDGVPLRFFARGVFRSPIVSWFPGPSQGLLGFCQKMVWAVSTLSLSLVDWPLRYASQGRLLGTTGLAHPMPRAHDTKLARELWNLSADIAKLPRNPLMPPTSPEAAKK